MLKAAAERGVQVHVIVYKEVEAALTLNSAHTKHALEYLHPNIRVFRHPDHAPSGTDVTAELGERLGNLTNFDLATASKDAVASIYGEARGVVLFWAHHEKLLIVDRKLAFMGGLDLCFGRWDTNSHPIADAHPGNLDAVLFSGQDYNNARVYDFADVQRWSQNKLDRTKSSRMGWTDVALSMGGRIVNDLVSHFVDRWNFVLEDKYAAKDPDNYHPLSGGGLSSAEGVMGAPSSAPDEDSTDVFSHEHPEGHATSGDMHVQLVRRYVSSDPLRRCLIVDLCSCTDWSSGHETENSIYNAYIEAIKSSKHFVYIENQVRSAPPSAPYTFPNTISSSSPQQARSSTR